MADTLTRAQAHELVDAAAQMGGLSHLAAAWDVPGYWNAGAEWDADAFHALVDERITNSERERAYGPSDDDETDLPDVDFDAVDWEG